jgi:hypothetical protein
MALGANRSNVVVMVMRRALVLVAIGFATEDRHPSSPGWWAPDAHTTLQRQHMRPITPAGAQIVLAAAAALAGFITAQRATSIEPMNALPTEGSNPRGTAVLRCGRRQSLRPGLISPFDRIALLPSPYLELPARAGYLENIDELVLVSQ